MAVSVQNRSGVPSPIIPLSLTQNYQKEIEEQMPTVYPSLVKYYRRIENGERDLYF